MAAKPTPIPLPRPRRLSAGNLAPGPHRRSQSVEGRARRGEGRGRADFTRPRLSLQRLDDGSGDADSPHRRARPVSEPTSNRAGYGNARAVPPARKSHSAPNDTPTFDLRSRAEEGRGSHRHTAGRAGTTSGHDPRDLGAHLAVPPKPHPATCNEPFVEVAPPPAWRGRDQLKTGKMSSLSGRAIDECKEDARSCAGQFYLCAGLSKILLILGRLRRLLPGPKSDSVENALSSL
eukprot:SAG25_NODE_3631_length_1017_cov_122.092593_1_plen_233_part_10